MTQPSVLEQARAVVEHFFEMPWSDGLPLIPPSPEGLDWMLQGTCRESKEVIAVIPPALGKASVGRIAVNGLMAGCRPEYMPVLIAAVQAVTDPGFRLCGVQGTTDAVAPLLVLNGPIPRRLGFVSGSGCFGHGFRSNATVGRALNLMLMTLGGALPGAIGQSTLSQPGRFSSCIMENAEPSGCDDCRCGLPSTGWPPLHVERGFDATASTVTAVPALPMSQVADDCSRSAEGLLTSLCDSMAILGNPAVYRGSETVVTFPPELVALLHRDGWTKQDVRCFVHQHARRSVRDLSRGGEWNKENLLHLSRSFDVADDTTLIPALHSPEDLLIVAAGGEGRWMALMPCWGYGARAVTRQIDETPRECPK